MHTESSRQNISRENSQQLYACQTVQVRVYRRPAIKSIHVNSLTQPQMQALTFKLTAAITHTKSTMQRNDNIQQEHHGTHLPVKSCRHMAKKLADS